MSEKTQDKAALKALREARKDWIERAREAVKQQNKAVKAIREQLQDGPRTVPEIAEAIGAGTAETLWYVAALKKYGRVVEVEKDGGYFRYGLNATAKTEDTE